MIMKKMLLLMVLFSFGCSTKYSDIEFRESDVNKLAKDSESETWCEAFHCFNGGGYTGILKLHLVHSNSKSLKFIYDGISHECNNYYKKITKFNENKTICNNFLEKLEKLGIFNMKDIEFEKLPVKENADNPWEDSFIKIPPSSYMMFRFYIKIGKKVNKFEGGNIEIFKDDRYKKIVELFNVFFKQRLGGLKFD